MSAPSNHPLPLQYLQQVLKATERLTRKTHIDVLGSVAIVDASIASRKVGTAKLNAARHKLQELKKRNKVLRLKHQVVRAAERALVVVLEERGREVEGLEEIVEGMKRKIKALGG